MYTTPRTTSSERFAAVLAHLSTIVAAIVSAGWLSFVGPLVLWFMYRDRSRFVRKAAAGSFNFNIGIWVMVVIAWILMFTVVLAPVSWVLFAIAFIASLWCHIRAALLANRGELYDYPFQIRILS